MDGLRRISKFVLLALMQRLARPSLQPCHNMSVCNCGVPHAESQHSRSRTKPINNRLIPSTSPISTLSWRKVQNNKQAHNPHQPRRPSLKVTNLLRQIRVCLTAQQAQPRTNHRIPIHHEGRLNSVHGLAQHLLRRQHVRLRHAQIRSLITCESIKLRQKGPLHVTATCKASNSAESQPERVQCT